MSGNNRQVSDPQEKRMDDDEYDPQTPVRVLGWGVRRRDGGITASTEGWARDVHEMVGLPLVRFDPAAGSWVDAA